MVDELLVRLHVVTFDIVREPFRPDVSAVGSVGRPLFARLAVASETTPGKPAPVLERVASLEVVDDRLALYLVPCRVDVVGRDGKHSLPTRLLVAIEILRLERSVSA